jgi:hypothetical protein
VADVAVEGGDVFCEVRVPLVPVCPLDEVWLALSDCVEDDVVELEPPQPATASASTTPTVAINRPIVPSLLIPGMLPLACQETLQIHA